MLSTLGYVCKLLYKSVLQTFRLPHSKCPLVWNQLSLDHSHSSASVTDQNLLLFHEKDGLVGSFCIFFPYHFLHSSCLECVKHFTKKIRLNRSSRQRMLSDIWRDNKQFLKRQLLQLQDRLLPCETPKSTRLLKRSCWLCKIEDWL